MRGQVLIFEGDSEFAGELRDEFARLGFSADVVDEALAGFQKALLLRPHLILVSVELPRSNGFSICNKLKRDPTLKDIPLVIMSSESTELTFEEHKKLKTTRAQAYVHKPVSFGDLLTIVQPFLPKEVALARASLQPPALDDDILVDSVVSDERELESTGPVDTATTSAKSSLAPTTALAVPRARSALSSSPAAMTTRVDSVAQAPVGVQSSKVAEQELRLLREMLTRKEREVQSLREKLVDANAKLETLRREQESHSAADKPSMASLERAKNALTIASVAMEELYREMSKDKS